MNPFRWLRNFVKGFRDRSSSERFVEYLRSTGIVIGEHTIFTTPRDIIVDVTRPWLIEIGSHVVICARVVLLTHGYDWCVLHRQNGEILGSSGKIKIGDNVFVGLGATILKGVTIGDNVIVGAGSVVTKDLPGGGVYVGNPARYVCSLEEYRGRRRQKQLEEAVECACEYHKRFGKLPPKEALHEFFYLFEEDAAGLPESYQKMFALNGDPELSRAFFEARTPLFSGYHAFLRHCGLPVDAPSSATET